MKTLLVIVLVVAALIWVMRLMRRREIEKFRDADMTALAEMKKDFPDVEPQQEVSALRIVPSLAECSAQPLVTSGSPVLKSIILTERQRRMLEMLERVLVARYRVFVNLAMSDLMTTSAAQRVSFVICDGHYLSVEAALEFENQLDEIVIQHFAATGKCLLSLSDSETETSLTKKLRETGVGLIKKGAENGVEMEVRATATAEKQRCPKCYGGMKFKAPTTGKNAGKRYWLCNTYPQCRGVQSA